jgi:hypothetical protein
MLNSPIYSNYPRQKQTNLTECDKMEQEKGGRQNMPQKTVNYSKKKKGN